MKIICPNCNVAIEAEMLYEEDGKQCCPICECDIGDIEDCQKVDD